MQNKLKIQKLMVDVFAVKARANDQLANISDLSAKLGGSNSAENDQIYYVSVLIRQNQSALLF